MKKNIFTIVMCFVLFQGCASIKDKAQQFWGSSYKHLEEARVDSLYQTIPCSLEECYDAVKLFINDNNNHLFQERPDKGLLVVMNIQQAIETTEVGVFFTPLSSEETEVELSSLSTPAKKTFADALFPYLEESFSQR